MEAGTGNKTVRVYFVSPKAEGGNLSLGGFRKGGCWQVVSVMLGL